MKKIIALFLSFLFSASVMYAGNTVSWTTNVGSGGIPTFNDAGVQYTFVGICDSIATATSHSFSFGAYNNANFQNDPITAFYYNTAGSGKPHLQIVLKGSFDGTNFSPIDTITTSDSSGTIGKILLDLNGYHCSLYQLVVTGVTNGSNVNSNSTTFRVWFILTRKPYGISQGR